MDEKTPEQIELEAFIESLKEMHFADVVTIRNELDKFITEDAHRRGFRPYGKEILGQ